MYWGIVYMFDVKRHNVNIAVEMMGKYCCKPK